MAGYSRPPRRGLSRAPLARLRLVVALGIAVRCDDVVADSPSLSLGSRSACAALRAANVPRALFVTRDSPAWLTYLGGLVDSGWDVGVLAPGCQRMLGPRACPRAAGAGASAAEPLSWVRQTGAELTAGDVLDAVATFRPAIVLPDDTRQCGLLVRAARLCDARQCTARARAAAQALSCSLPRERRHWDAWGSKLALLELAAASGVRSPPSVVVPPAASGAAARAARLAAASALLPAVIKVEQDGAGRGVRACRTPKCLATVLGSAENHTALVQGRAPGATVSFSAVCLDGAVVAGFAQLLAATHGQLGPALAAVSVNAPRAGDALARLVAALGFSGVAGADFRVDASGRATLIDVNLRASLHVTLSGAALGVGANLLERLRRALGGEATPPWPGALDLRRSVTYVIPTMDGQLFQLMTCADVLVLWPWALAPALAHAVRRHWRVEPRTCTLLSTRVRGLRLRQRCGQRALDAEGERAGVGAARGRCAHECAQHALGARSPAYSAPELPSLCAAAGGSTGWRAEHANCTAEASRVNGAWRARQGSRASSSAPRLGVARSAARQAPGGGASHSRHAVPGRSALPAGRLAAASGLNGSGAVGGIKQFEQHGGIGPAAAALGSTRRDDDGRRVAAVGADAAPALQTRRVAVGRHRSIHFCEYLHYSTQ